MRKIIGLCILLLHFVSSWSQVQEDGSFKMGSIQPNHLSKLLIQGPNKPFGVDSKRDISFEFNAAGRSIIRSYRGGSWDTYMQFLTSPYIGGGEVVRLHISGDGNIGIGVVTPKSKLEVNGTIRAKEVKIESTGWADFVFAEDYELPKLAEVENHIKEYKHLPNIPSEAEVKENGIQVGEMQIKLLQKIEELTLYTIQLEKRVKELEEK